MSKAPTNREIWKNKWHGRSEPVNAFARTVVRRMGTGRGRRLLDVGCGNGQDSLYLAKAGFQVTATDFSESGIEILSERAAAHALPIDARLHDTAQKFPFESGYFDVVYAHLALHYFDDSMTRKVFCEMHRLLRKGGVLFVKCKSVDDSLYGKGENVGPDMYRSGHTRHFFSAEYLTSVLAEFEIVSLRKSASSYHGKRSAFVAAVAHA